MAERTDARFSSAQFCPQRSSGSNQQGFLGFSLVGRALKIPCRSCVVKTPNYDSNLCWVWIDGENAKSNENLWGPNEPSGDGKCGAFLNAIEFSSNWDGYGWRWNDLPCTSRAGYICEEPLGM